MTDAFWSPRCGTVSFQIQTYSERDRQTAREIQRDSEKDRQTARERLHNGGSMARERERERKRERERERERKEDLAGIRSPMAPGAGDLSGFFALLLVMKPDEMESTKVVALRAFP